MEFLSESFLLAVEMSKIISVLQEGPVCQVDSLVPRLDHFRTNVPKGPRKQSPHVLVSLPSSGFVRSSVNSAGGQPEGQAEGGTL